MITKVTHIMCASTLAMVGCADVQDISTGGHTDVQPAVAQQKIAFDQTYRDASGRIEIRVTSSDSGSSGNPHADCAVDANYQLVGGGAEVVNDGNPGALLVGSYPTPDTHWDSWHAVSKAHAYPYTHQVRCFAIGMAFLDANGNYYPPASVAQYLNYQSNWGQSSGSPSASVAIPTGYRIIGGGALTTYVGAGILMTQSSPIGNTWQAASKSQKYVDNGQVHVFAIGISTGYIPEIGGYIDTTYSLNPLANSTYTGSGYGTVSFSGGIPSGYVLTGVGGTATYNGGGRLLTQIAPYSDSPLDPSLGHDELIFDGAEPYRGCANTGSAKLPIGTRDGVPLAQSAVRLCSTFAQNLCQCPLAICVDV